MASQKELIEYAKQHGLKAFACKEGGIIAVDMVYKRNADGEMVEDGLERVHCTNATELRNFLGY